MKIRQVERDSQAIAPVDEKAMVFSFLSGAIAPL
jgi:hypothetical protein